MNWLKNKLVVWLGLSEMRNDIEKVKQVVGAATTIGVDVNFGSPHMIIVFSKLNGGQIRHIDAQFDGLKELEEFVRVIKERYGARKMVYDMPNSIRMYGFDSF